MRDRWTGARALGLRWLGVGLAASLAVVTLGLWVTGRIGLYINPDASWWAISMSVVLLIGAVASCAVPIAHDDDEHGHERERAGGADETPHGTPSPPLRRGRADARSPRGAPLARAVRSPLAAAATAVGALVSTGFVVSVLVLPPATLSAELALARTAGAAPVLSTSATLALASSDNTASFGIGEWASVLTTSTDPARFVGEPAVLTGFVAPGGDDTFNLSRLVMVHCVIDAQAASVPVALRDSDADLAPGAWVEVVGEFARSAGGGLTLAPVSVTPVAEPVDPYEY